MVATCPFLSLHFVFSSIGSPNACDVCVFDDTDRILCFNVLVELLLAHFEIAGRKIHGTTLSIAPRTSLAFDLWGPLYESSPKVWDRELEVSPMPDENAVTITQGELSKDYRRRSYRLSCETPVGRVIVQAVDESGSPWSTFYVNVDASSTPSARRYTKASLSNAAGAIGWPGWRGACANVNALADALARVSGGVLKHNTTLQGAGRNMFYEHSAGLALDIFLDSKKPASRKRAHNIIRFLVENRDRVGFHNMFYENFGFGRSGVQGPSKGHFDHIHIDWMDGDLAEPPGFSNRPNWTAITWSQEASEDAFLRSGEAVRGLTNAWSDETLPFDSADSLY
jgi:hypothetical protein